MTHSENNSGIAAESNKKAVNRKSSIVCGRTPFPLTIDDLPMTNLLLDSAARARA
jgi:hypothetical protein